MKASTARMQLEEVPMTDEDRQWLRHNTRSRGLIAAVELTFFLLFFVATLALLGLFVVMTRESGRDLVMLASTLMMVILVTFFGRHLWRTPRSWHRVKQAERGQVPKHIVSGVLTDFDTSAASVRYGFDGETLDVVLPLFSNISVEGNTVARPKTCAARTGVPVRLHVLELWPGRAPLLLRADYDGAEPTQEAIERISENDRRFVREDEVFVRNLFLGMTLASAIAGLFLWPFFFCAGIFLAAGLIFRTQMRRVRRATFKLSIRGRVDEALTYRTTDPNSSLRTIVHAYRIGGVLYNAGQHGADAAQPGERVTLDYLDRGRKGRQLLFFHREGHAQTAAARQALGHC